MSILSFPPLANAAAKRERMIGLPSDGSAAWRHGLVFVLGSAAALSAFAFGMPGQGEFVPAIWLASFVALMIAPGWPAFVVFMLGLTGFAALLDMSDGVFGLVLLVVGVASAVAAHGVLSVSVLVRLSRLGLRRGLLDARVMCGAGLALAIALVGAWFAAELGQNLP